MELLNAGLKNLEKSWEFEFVIKSSFVLIPINLHVNSDTGDHILLLFCCI
jgi:hypothetical protein